MKQEIVAASFAAGASVSSVARRYDVNANQVFAWRKLYRERGRAASELGGPMLVPVTIAEPVGGDGAGRIEIELAGGYLIRVGGGVDAAALRCVLDVLERRPVGGPLGEGQ